MLLKQFNKNANFEIGCDEAGRGAIAGPVFAACVILKKNFYNKLINDSKKLSEKKRYLLREIILNEALDWSVAWIDNYEIDRINILNAAIKAMHKALDKILVPIDFIIVDGNKFKPYKDIDYQTIIGGDGKYLSIAAASILAKTFRDDFMKKIHNFYPQYNWLSNKGYATKEHKQAVLKFGLSEFHRKTFCDFYLQKKLF